VRQVLTAAHHFIDPEQYAGSTDLDVEVCTPLVVTTSPIFEARAERESNDLEIIQVGRSSVRVTSGEHHSNPTSTVTIVHADYLHTVLRECEELRKVVNDFMAEFDPALLGNDNRDPSP